MALSESHHQPLSSCRRTYLSLLGRRPQPRAHNFRKGPRLRFPSNLQVKNRSSLPCLQSSLWHRLSPRTWLLCPPRSLRALPAAPLRLQACQAPQPRGTVQPCPLAVSPPRLDPLAPQLGALVWPMLTSPASSSPAAPGPRPRFQLAWLLHTPRTTNIPVLQVQPSCLPGWSLLVEPQKRQEVSPLLADGCRPATLVLILRRCFLQVS